MANGKIDQTTLCLSAIISIFGHLNFTHAIAIYSKIHGNAPHEVVMNKEIELKYRLSSHHDLQRFMDFVKPLAIKNSRSIRQENIYFDDNKLSLRKNNISLRLRQEENIYLLCAKQSIKKDCEKLSIRLEYEGILKKDIAKLIKDEYLSPIEAFNNLPSKTREDDETKTTLFRHIENLNIQYLYKIGSFTNFRTIIPIQLQNKNLNLEFDHSYFPKN